MEKINCFDIETVRAYPSLTDAPEEFQTAWRDFAEKKYPEKSAYEMYFNHAALFPEYAKVICISVKPGNGDMVTFTADLQEVTEKSILEAFIKLCEEGARMSPILLGHYIKRFDIPFIIVRMVANGIKVPNWLKMYGVKPWEAAHIDTWEIWKGGNFGTSQAADIQSICLVLGIQSPKAEFSGNQVGSIFYSEDPDRFTKIAKYCERDTMATALIYNQMFQLKMI